MYERIDNDELARAEERQAQVIGGYRASEQKKLTSYAQRETKRHPATNKDLGDLFANWVSRAETLTHGSKRDSAPEEKPRSGSAVQTVQFSSNFLGI